MKKKIGLIKLRILAGKATPAPPIGPSLGQKGLNIMEFCKAFNLRTKDFSSSDILPVLIHYYSNKTYSFIIKNPTVTFLLKKKLNLDKFSDNIKKNIFINISLIIEILKLKYNDFNTSNLYLCFKTILGSIKSIGISIVYEET